MEDKMNPEKRRRLKLEEIMKNHGAETRSSGQESACDDLEPLPDRYTTFYVEIDDIKYEVMAPERPLQTAKASSSQYSSAFAYHVENALKELFKAEVFYEKMHDTVHAQVKMHAGKIAENNFPIVEEELEDSDKEYENAVSDDIDEYIRHYSGRVARFVESHVGMVATFIDDIIQGYSKSASIDIMGVVDSVSEFVGGIVTEKVIDIIYDALVETLLIQYTNKIDRNYITDGLLSDIQEDSRLVADLIADATCLIMDDTLTVLIGNAFKNMRNSSGAQESDTHDIVMENVAERVLEMQI